MNDSGEPAAVSPPSIILFVLGVVALLIAGLQPVLLGAMHAEGRLALNQIGEAATVELLGVGVACGLAAAKMPTLRMRLSIGLACLVHGAINLACLLADGAAFIALRGASGLAAGVMLWSCVAMIARSARPERLAGAFVTLQTLAQLAMAAILPLSAMRFGGADGGFAALGALSLVAALLAQRGPDRLSPLPASTASGGLTAAAWAGLCTSFCLMAFFVSLFVYLEALAGRAPATAAVAGLGASAVLGCQVLGGAVATFVGARVRAPLALAGAMILGAAGLGLVWLAPSAPIFLAGAGMFGFAWLFSLPYQTALLIALDPTRRGAMQLGAAQLLGSAFGPLAASLFVQGDRLEGVTAFATAVLGAAVLSMPASLLIARRAAAAEARGL